jgi:hypothetical protein
MSQPARHCGQWLTAGPTPQASCGTPHAEGRATMMRGGPSRAEDFEAGEELRPDAEATRRQVGSHE